MLLLVLLLLRRYLWDLTITYQLLSGTLPRRGAATAPPSPSRSSPTCEWKIRPEFMHLSALALRCYLEES